MTGYVTGFEFLFIFFEDFIYTKTIQKNTRPGEFV